MGRVFCGLLLLATLLSSQTVNFFSQPEIATGQNPVSFAIGNFTGSGKLDLAIAERGASALNVVRGLGNGYFQTFTTQDVGSYPLAVATGDFNRDGRLDLAVANYAGNTVSVLLGNGNGTFVRFPSLSTKGPSSIAVADFNGDGKLDLAVTETNSNTVSIFLGRGDGTFYQQFTYAVGQRPLSITTADFNGDGKLDLAIANLGSNSVSILLGIGNGTFQAPRDFAAGELPAFVVTGDFNGDGKLDLAVANATGSSTGTVSVLLGLGNGAFEVPLSFAVGANPTALVAADFNEDGKLDLAVADTGSNTVSVLLGIGNGTFLRAQNFTVGSGPAWISAADLNGDGKPDLITANLLSNTVSILINDTGPPNQPIIVGGSIVNAASFLSGAVSPGEMITIFGSNLGPTQGVGFELTGSGFITTTLAGTEVLFGGIPAPLIYVSSGQITAMVPYAIAGLTSTVLEVESNGYASAPITVPVAVSTPGLFTLNSSGIGEGAILNQDFTTNSPNNPAAIGSYVSLFLTGEGQTNPAGITGAITAELPGLFVTPQPLLPVAVTVGGQPAPISFYGEAPGMVSGILQINAQIPAGLVPGTLPISVSVGGNSSQTGVTISVH